MRIRTIKPEFFTHEGLFEIEIETGFPMRIAFAGLWCAADRRGRFKWEPRRLGVQILPYDQVDFSRVLDALTTRGFVRKYKSSTGVFGVIPSFEIHQVINNREKESDIPEPLEYIDCDACLTRESRVSHAGKAEGKGREGNMEGKGRDLLSADGREESYPPIVETLWSIFPPQSRNRSSKHKLYDALKKTRPIPLDGTIIESAHKWSTCHEWTKDGGQYAPGCHIWVKDRKWESEPLFTKTSSRKEYPEEAKDLPD